MNNITRRITQELFYNELLGNDFKRKMNKLF